MSWYKVYDDKDSLAEVIWNRKPRMVGKIEKAYIIEPRNHHRYKCFFIIPIFSINNTGSYDYNTAYPRYWHEARVKILCSPTTKDCENCKYKFGCYTSRGK
jgi:hypothetical protein